jgi:hypothetical protein
MRLSPTEFHLTQERIEKINARAAKKGFTGRFEVTGTRVEASETTEFGFPVTKVYYDTEITGEAPSYNGWKFLAVLDWDDFAGLVVRTSPGVESVDRSSLVEGYCDHCNTNRRRNLTYLVLNTETGEQKQVGSTCIKDFLGWDGTPVFVSEQEVREEGFGGFGVGGWDGYSVETVMALSVAAIKAFGWVPASHGYGTTKQAVVDCLSRRTKHNAEIQDAVAAQVEGSYDRAALVLDYVRSAEFAGESEYVLNLKAIATADEVTYKNLGILVSAPQAYAKHVERQSLIAERESFPASEHFGAVGDKVEFTGTITLIRWIDGAYGTTVLYKIRANDGRIVSWFASREALGDMENVEVTIKGTIKKHDEYQGQKSTVLTRCKAV